MCLKVRNGLGVDFLIEIGDFLKVSQTFSGHFPVIFRSFSGHVPDIFRTFSAHVPDIFRTFSDTFPDIFRHKKYPNMLKNAKDEKTTNHKNDSTARHGTARHGTARHNTARHGTARHGTILAFGFLTCRRRGIVQGGAGNRFPSRWGPVPPGCRVNSRRMSGHFPQDVAIEI